MKIDKKVIENHGLKDDEYKKIVELIGKDPNFLELGIFSAMWNEHCSYKSSKMHLKKMPTKNKRVIQGPGENAGVIDIDDGDAIVFKIESHNHPSYLEPYQGAATGVGGILRDVFTMGARPIANLNSIHFGSPTHKKTKNLLSGVVSGIGGYGNSVGIPTVGGETNFDKCYNENILVNAMAVGLTKTNKIFYSKAEGVDMPVIYVGSKTGRDGIHGASMASAEFDSNSEEKKPTVQVGDPFKEKLLLEACLELMKENSIISIQDMGAAGLTSSSIEMASKGNLGIQLNLDKVPCREHGMTPYEIMLSESQERMLIILKKGKEESAKKIFDKWNLDFSIIGKTTDGKNLLIMEKEKIVCDLPLKSLSSLAPVYDRKWTKHPLPKVNKPKNEYKNKIDESLIKLIQTTKLSNKSWVWEQYDQTVMGDTIQKPGGNSGVIRIHETNKAISVSVDSSANYCKAHPLTGGKQVVCENWRNLIAVGSKPIAITNCLNFGNPEKKDVMGQFVECVEGISLACKYLDYPIVSGNVSFYNETNSVPINPTPTIGGVGLIKNIDNMISFKLKNEGNLIMIIGKTKGHLDQSLFHREINRLEKGPPPEINLFNEKNNGLTVLNLIENKLLLSCHDISDGGILCSLTEMCIGGMVGAKLNKPNSLVNKYEYFFGEDQSRYLVEIKKENLKKIQSILKKNGVFGEIVAETQKNNLELHGEFSIKIEELKKLNSNWFKNFYN